MIAKERDSDFKGEGGGNAKPKALAVWSLRVGLLKSLADLRGCFPLVSGVMARMCEKARDG